MRLLKKLFTIGLCITIFFISSYSGFADDTWHLHDNEPEMSDDEEIELGKRVDEYIKKRFHLCTDTELNKRVNNITQKLVLLSDRKTLPYTCTIIESFSVNAFSAPGGYIYLTYGLLEFAENEDELAGIIGHEIAHASLKHVARLYHDVIEIFSHKDNGTSTDGNLILHTHLKEFEQEADSLGVFYACRAGFNPDGLPDFLERHLNFMSHHGALSILNFGFFVTVNTRINLLREYILTLKKEEKKEEIYESND
ncbi:MAG: hypothetical protein E3K32_09270 [wastewater metagenome]|nr:hypothetical protein [Candidatus Loosdrechtia aerotolerans]